MTTLRSPALEPVQDPPSEPLGRDPWLDNIKMALIVLVVLGHAWTLLPSVPVVDWSYDFVYSWHMPAFVLVTGHLSRSMTWSPRKLWTLVQTVAVPYFVFEATLAWYRDRVGGVELPDLFTEPHFPMWFLAALFLWRLATPVFLRVPRGPALGLAVGISLVLALGADETLDLPRVLGLLPFFVVGLHLSRADWDRVRTSIPVGLAVIGLLVTLLATRVVHSELSTSWFYYNATYPDLAPNDAAAMATRFAVLVLGLLGTVSFFVLVPRGRGWFTALGPATLVVYLFHGFVVLWLRYSEFPDWAADHLATAFVVTTVGGIALALVLAAPPVARSLNPFVDPVGWLTLRRRRAPTSE